MDGLTAFLCWQICDGHLLDFHANFEPAGPRAKARLFLHFEEGLCLGCTRFSY